MTKRALIALSSLCAEGTPVLALEMCRVWNGRGVEPYILTLSETPADLAPEFEALGVPVEHARVRTGRGARYYDMASAVYRQARRLRPNAFLSMPFGWHAFLAAGARQAGVARIAAHVGNYPPYAMGIAFQKFRLLVQAGRAVTDKLICCSEYVRSGVERHFRVPGDALEMIYNGCPVESIATRAHAARAQKSVARPCVGMIARLEIHKDQPTLIRAAGVLARRGISVDVYLVGEGSRRAEYEAMAKSLGVTDRVQLVGVRRDVPELLGTFDGFVFAAKPDEGLGVALVEAMAARTPIIATDVGACREVLSGGEFGKLIPPNDATALADAIADLLAHPEEASRRAGNAQDRALSVFRIEAMADAYAECLRLY